VRLRIVLGALAALPLLWLSNATGASPTRSERPGASPAPAGTANLWVDTSGGRCARQSIARGYVDADACGSLHAAYGAAQAGDTINVRDGTYGSDTMAALDKEVTVRAAGPGRPSFGVSDFAGSGVTIKGLKFEFRGGTTPDDDWVCLGPPPAGRGLNGELFMNGIVNPCARNITFDNVEIDGLRNPGTPGNCAREGIKFGGDGFTFKNGSVHGIYDRKGADLDSRNITIENTTFYDIRVRNVCSPDVHNECIYISRAEGAVFRNDRFINCPTMGLFFSGNPDTDSDNVTLEGNVFTHTIDSSDNWHAAPCGLKIGAGPSRINGWIVRYNTFETSPCNDDLPAGSVPGQWYGNLGGAGCIAGFVYHNNVGETCGGANSIAVRPATNDRNARNQAPFFVDAPAGDFHLKASAAAVNRGDVGNYPPTDADGEPRPVGTAPDAGAYEYVPPGSITYELSGSGTASWKQNGAGGYVEALRYGWKGTLTFTLPAAAHRDPHGAKFRTGGVGLLAGTWVGSVKGRRATGADPYSCTYRAAKVVTTVRAVLRTADRGDALELTLYPRTGKGFFSPSAQGASVACTTPVGRGGPPRFSPAALFQEGIGRDALDARKAAVITIPRTLLSKRSATVSFPTELDRAPRAGHGDAVGKSRGKLTLQAG
jgi:hypothetical protein